MALASSMGFARFDERDVPSLEEFQFAHNSILRAIADLDEITRGPLPAKDRIVDARWSISRASLSWRGLWNRAHAHLSSNASSEAADGLQRLRESDMVLLRASTDHIFKWRIDTVMRQWSGYCEASHDMCGKMKAAIGAEKRVLYPLLVA